MNQKVYIKLSSAIFLIIGLIHLMRLLFGWPVVIDGLSVSTAASAVIAAISLVISYYGLQLAK